MDAKATNNPEVIDKFLAQGKQTSLTYEMLRTPTASQGEGGALGEEEARKRGNTVGIRDQAMDIAKANGHKVSRDNLNLMPTPNTMDHLPARTPEQKALNKGKGGYANVRETVVNDLMPTPTTRDYKDGTEPHERNGVVQTDTVARAVFNSGEVLLPTTTTSDWKGANNSGSASTSAQGLATKIDNLPVQAWGKFEPAIRRWEETLGRSAPAPTKPDGKDGAHRLSSAFTEWMMGLPEGWITDVGLSRNEELKACGNGVVPQQAELALRILLEGIDFESKRGAGMTVLPTPTVMDQRDGKHFRSVAIRELADGNNRGLNLNNIVETGLTEWEDGDKFEIVDGKAVKTNG